MIAPANLAGRSLLSPPQSPFLLDSDTQERRIVVCLRSVADYDERQMADRPRCVEPLAVSVWSSDSASAATTSAANGSCTGALHSDGVLHQRHHRIWRSGLSRDRGGRSGSVTAWHSHSHLRGGSVRRDVPRSRHWRAGSKTACGSVYPRLRSGAAIWPPIRSRSGDPSPAVIARLQPSSDASFPVNATCSYDFGDVLSKVLGQAALGLSEDFEDGLPIGGRQACVS